MVNILSFLDDVARLSDFAFIDEPRCARARQAVVAGIECILKCQIKVGGNLTVWCGQHDEPTLEPRWGRTFEPAALTSAESAGILRFLMSQNDPSPAIRSAIQAGARWFESTRIVGIRQTVINGDKVIVPDKDAHTTLGSIL